VITENSLGAVHRNMTGTAAAHAAGLPLADVGDGVVRPKDTSIGGGTQLQYSWGATCFDAFVRSSERGTRVWTPAGVALGDAMSHVRSDYPNATRFVPDPAWTGPGYVKGGLLVRYEDGVLLFVGGSADGLGGTITSIRGAPAVRTAASLFC
jgi:hypothetical protein